MYFTMQNEMYIFPIISFSKDLQEALRVVLVICRIRSLGNVKVSTNTTHRPSIEKRRGSLRNYQLHVLVGFTQSLQHFHNGIDHYDRTMVRTMMGNIE